MWIKGFVHFTDDEAFLADVHIVPDIRRRGGEYVGWMELTTDEVVMVKRHPSGFYHGQIMKEV